MSRPYDLMSTRAQTRGMLQAGMRTSTAGTLPEFATVGELQASYCRIPGGRTLQL